MQKDRSFRLAMFALRSACFSFAAAMMVALSHSFKAPFVAALPFAVVLGALVGTVFAEHYARPGGRWDEKVTELLDHYDSSNKSDKSQISRP